MIITILLLFIVLKKFYNVDNTFLLYTSGILLAMNLLILILQVTTQDGDLLMTFLMFFI